MDRQWKIMLYESTAGDKPVERFLLLHGFKKKTQKTLMKEVRIAQNRLREFQTRQ